MNPLSSWLDDPEYSDVDWKEVVVGLVEDMHHSVTEPFAMAMVFV